MTFSLNEVEALAKKATRGAGYAWGLAEEAAKATRFLCEQGFDGCAALANVLQTFDRKDTVQCSLQWDGAVWRAAEHELCPIYLGAAISDRADQIQNQPSAGLWVVQPVILLPFAAQIARAQDTTVSVRADAAVFATDGTRVSIRGVPPNHADCVEVRLGGDLSLPLPLHSRAHPEPAVWERLNSFAHRTYAPATEESRQKGAG